MFVGHTKTDIRKDGEIRLAYEWTSRHDDWYALDLGLLDGGLCGTIGLYEEDAFKQLMDSIYVSREPVSTTVRSKQLLYASSFCLVEEYESPDVGDDYRYVTLPEELISTVIGTEGASRTVAFVGCGDHLEITAWATWLETKQASKEALREILSNSGRSSQ